jgi:hypothetical protein
MWQSRLAPSTLVERLLCVPPTQVPEKKVMRVGIVDYLCVASSERGKNIAGRLIDYLHYDFGARHGIKVFAFHRELKPCSFAYPPLAVSQYKYGVLSSRTCLEGEWRVMPKLHDTMSALYRQIVGGSGQTILHGLDWKNYAEFAVWLMSPERYVVADLGSGHVTLLENACARTGDGAVAEVLWSNIAAPVEDGWSACVIKHTPFRAVTWGEQSCFEPSASMKVLPSGPTYFYMFNWACHTYLAPQATRFF